MPLLVGEGDGGGGEGDGGGGDGGDGGGGSEGEGGGEAIGEGGEASGWGGEASGEGGEAGGSVMFVMFQFGGGTGGGLMRHRGRGGPAGILVVLKTIYGNAWTASTGAEARGVT